MSDDAPKVKYESWHWPKVKPSGLHTRPVHEQGAPAAVPEVRFSGATEPETAPEPEPEAPHRGRRRAKDAESDE